MTTPSHEHCYTLKFIGALDAEFLAGYCPAGTRLISEGNCFTLANLKADQSAVLGLLRYLHNLGCTIISLTTEQGEPK